MPSNNEKRTRRTPEQILADLEHQKKTAEEAARKKQAQINAQIRDTKAKMAEKKRKEDTHLKVVNGALAFAFFENYSYLAEQYVKWVKNSSESEDTKEKICARLNGNEAAVSEDTNLNQSQVN